MNRNAISRAYILTLTRGGLTLNRSLTVVQPKGGYAVSVSGGVKCDNYFGEFKSAIQRVAFTHPRHFIGTWFDSGYIYVDPVELVGALDVAVDLAAKHEQVAFYDFATSSTRIVADELAARAAKAAVAVEAPVEAPQA